MSTYSNDPQQTKWDIWFITSIILFIIVLIIMTILKSEQLPIWYDALTLATFVNLVYCIVIGLKKY